MCNWTNESPLSLLDTDYKYMSGEQTILRGSCTWRHLMLSAGIAPFWAWPFQAKLLPTVQKSVVETSPPRLEQKRQRLSVYPAHLALNCRTYKYYHPRTNLNLAAGEGGGLKKKRKNGLNCDSGSSPVYFLSLPTGLFILSSVFAKKRQNPKQNDYRSMSYIGWMFSFLGSPHKWTNLTLKAQTVTM